MLTYLTVSEEEGEEPIEIPTEEDGTLLLSTLAAQFPGACGLKFRNIETKAFRGVRLVEGKLLPPDEGWSGIEFISVYPKENKRKSDDVLENCTAKTKRIDSKFQAKCLDLVVLGLPWKTTDQELKEYFETFGELKLATVKLDANGKSKGYGFIRYANYESQIRAMSKSHIIDGRYCVCKVPDSKGGQPLEMTSKVFIGRLTENITKEDLKEFFSSYGDIVDIFVPNPFRGFAFITFLDPYVAQGLCGEDYIIKGTSVNVLPANYKSKPKNIQQSKPNQNHSFNQTFDNKPSRDSYQQPSWSNNQMPQQSSQYQPQHAEMPNLQTLGITTQVPPPSHVSNNNPLNSFANLSSLALAPTILAAALNQAGFGSLLSNLQNNSSGYNNAPPQQSSGPSQQPNQYGVPPPQNQQSLHNSQQSLHSQQQPLHSQQQSLHNSQQPQQQSGWGSSLYSVSKKGPGKPQTLKRPEKTRTVSMVKEYIVKKAKQDDRAEISGNTSRGSSVPGHGRALQMKRPETTRTISTIKQYIVGKQRQSERYMEDDDSRWATSLKHMSEAGREETTRRVSTVKEYIVKKQRQDDRYSNNDNDSPWATSVKHLVVRKKTDTYLVC